MAHPAYFREQAARYFRIARAKSDPKMVARLEAMGREFLARAEAAAARPRIDVGHPGSRSTDAAAPLKRSA